MRGLRANHAALCNASVGSRRNSPYRLQRCSVAMRPTPYALGRMLPAARSGRDAARGRSGRRRWRQPARRPTQGSISTPHLPLSSTSGSHRRDWRQSECPAASLRAGHAQAFPHRRKAEHVEQRHEPAASDWRPETVTSGIRVDARVLQFRAKLYRRRRSDTSRPAEGHRPDQQRNVLLRRQATDKADDEVGVGDAELHARGREAHGTGTP